MKTRRHPVLRIRPKRRALALGAVALHALCTGAWAQKPGSVVEPESSWMTMAIGLGVVLLACAPAFLNAKRTHLN